MGFCVDFEAHVIGANVGYNITAFSILIASLAMAQIAYIFISVFRAIKRQEEHFTLYLGYSLLTTFTLFLGK
jgi:hypothetical protein